MMGHRQNIFKTLIMTILLILQIKKNHHSSTTPSKVTGL